MGKLFKKPKDGGCTIWKILIIIAIVIANACFFISVLCKSVPSTEANVFSMILALVSLNIAVSFFIPMLITKHQVTDTVKDIVDKKFLEEKMERYATQMNIADVLRKVSGLLFEQKRYIWSLSCALNVLNEYMKITPDKPAESIRNLWISIEAMMDIVVNTPINPLLKNEFPISNAEIKLMNKKDWPKKIKLTNEINRSKEIKQKDKQLTEDIKDMLIWFYVEIFELTCQRENLISVIGYKFKERIDGCLDKYFIKIINETVEESVIKYEKIGLKIREYSELFEKAETQKSAEKTLKDFIGKIRSGKSK
jgi:hypothetical protein